MGDSSRPDEKSPGPRAGAGRQAHWAGMGAGSSATLDGDAVALRVVALVRAALAIGLAASGSFVPHLSDRAEWLFVLLGLVWVPWSCAVLFAADRPGRFAQLGGPLGDVVALSLMQALLPRSGTAVLLGYLIVVGFALYVAGRPFAALIGSAALAFTVVAQATLPARERLDSAALVPFSAALVALIFLFDRTIVLQRRAAARSERLQGQADAILARVADGVVVTDPEGRVVLSNPAARRIVGRREHDTIGLSCAEMLGLHIGERPLRCAGGCELLRVGDSADTALGCEVWRWDAGGRRQPLLANAAAVVDANGVLLEVVHSVRDVTRLKEAEEAKTMFLATASHELKTPLTVINGFAQTLLAYPDSDDRVREAGLEAIGRRAQELTKIVDRLLLSSRIEAGRVHVDGEVVDVGPLIRERTEALAAATGRTVRCEVAPAVPNIIGDETAIVTVVDHLLDNALKYSPGGGSIAARVTLDGIDVRIDVCDEGIGMSADEVAHCFEKFWQAESSDVRRFGGTGIGLYIVRSLVEAMDGRLDVASTVGRGTTFSVWLPLAPERKVSEVVPDVGESSSIREFMRQIGVPERTAQ